MRHGYRAGLRYIELLSNIYRYSILRNNNAGMYNAQLVGGDSGICTKKHISGNLGVEDQSVKLAV